VESINSGAAHATLQKLIDTTRGAT